MAKGNKNKGKTPQIELEEEPEEEEEDEDEEEEEKVIVELGDTQAVKTALDDSLVQTLTHRMGFPEDQAVSNLKIIFGMLSSAFGLFGQFHHWVGFPDFPNDRHILGVCVAGYMACSGVLTLIAMFMEKAFIMWYKGGASKENVEPPLRKSQDVPEWSKRIAAIKVESRLDRFETDYQVDFHIQTEDGTWHLEKEETPTLTIFKCFNQ